MGIGTVNTLRIMDMFGYLQAGPPRLTHRLQAHGKPEKLPGKNLPQDTEGEALPKMPSPPIELPDVHAINASMERYH